MTEKPNYTLIASGIYLVRTQAGFRKALKIYLGDSYSYMKRTLQSWPLSYPAIVCFSNGYQGYETVDCKCVAVETMRKALDEA